MKNKNPQITRNRGALPRFRLRQAYGATGSEADPVGNRETILRVVTMIRIKRAYDPPAKEDGARFLVDRLWPRGMKKETLHVAAWYKEAAPSNELRRWFSHDPDKWKDFQRRYRVELTANPAAWQPLLDAAENGDITLLYSAHDTEHNNAVALKAYLEENSHNTERSQRSQRQKRELISD